MSAPIAGQLPQGKLFHGHYEVVRCLSTGAMGAIYEVIDIKTQRRRALKVMLPSIVTDEDMRSRFKLEATVTANIESEHIVETFDADVDTETGAPFLVMELLRGSDLADVLTQRTRLAGPEVVQILAQAARALDKTHAAGIVHRDLKPENLFITRRDDGSIRVKILDFGIAKVVAASEGQQKKQQTINLGTPPYMSPEQILGDATIDHRADIYALGHIAYALLVGEPYWLEESRNGDTLYRLLLRMVDGVKEPATVRAQRYGMTLPPAFDDWFYRATGKNPSERFDRASELVVALADALNVPLHQRPPSASIPDGEWEIDSVNLPPLAVQRVLASHSDGPISAPTPSAPAAGTPLVGGFASPNHEAPIQVPPIPPLPSLAPGNPTPVETHVPVPQATPQKQGRKAIWALMAVALLLGFVGVFIVAGSSTTSVGKQPVTVESTSAAATAPPVPSASVVESAPPPASAAISPSAAPSDSTPLPPGSSIVKTSSSATNKIPSPNTTKTKQTGKHDPLKTL